MILDARDQRVDLERRVRLAVVGGGLVGLTLAHELGDDVDMLVIESGGLLSAPEYDDCNAGDCVGLPYPLTETRARQFGGATALWAGYCAPFDAHDFAERPWVSESGWPLPPEELRRYYPRAAASLNLADHRFDAADAAARAGIALPRFGEAVVPSLWRFGSPTLRLAEHALDRFSSSPHPTLVHATVVDVRLDADQTAVTDLVVRTLNGRQGVIHADHVVIACGGIETARLLLNADSQVPGGIGNAHGLVGRYFMEHPHLPIAVLDLAQPDGLRGFLQKHETGAGEILFNLGLGADVQEHLGLLNARAHVYRTPSMRLDESPRIGLFLEQAPHRDSRVRLADRSDALGMRRIVLDWRITDLEWHTYREAGALFRRAFEGAGCGRVTSLGESGDDRLILHSNHQLGTTRMADDPSLGVVDADGRVHGLSNLHIMGGSVYPTVSWANPTLTLMAMTFRLADHLRQALAA
jgi:choline dehydrogenase-like flavoprotein